MHRRYGPSYTTIPLFALLASRVLALGVTTTGFVRDPGGVSWAFLVYDFLTLAGVYCIWVLIGGISQGVVSGCEVF